MSRCSRGRMPLFVLALLLVSGCDLLDDKLEIKTEVPVSTGFATGIPIAPNAAVATTGTVNRGEADLPDVFDVESVAIDPDDVTFTAVAGKAGAALGNSDVDVTLLVNGAPAACLTIRIVNDVVTSIEPERATVGGCNATFVQQIVAAIPESQRPTVDSGLSASQIVERVNAALRSAGFNAGVMVHNRGDARGIISIGRMTFRLDI